MLHFFIPSFVCLFTCQFVSFLLENVAWVDFPTASSRVRGICSGAYVWSFFFFFFFVLLFVCLRVCVCRTKYWNNNINEPSVMVLHFLLPVCCSLQVFLQLGCFVRVIHLHIDIHIRMDIFSSTFWFQRIMIFSPLWMNQPIMMQNGYLVTTHDSGSPGLPCSALQRTWHDEDNDDSGWVTLNVVYVGFTDKELNLWHPPVVCFTNPLNWTEKKQPKKTKKKNVGIGGLLLP